MIRFIIIHLPNYAEKSLHWSRWCWPQKARRKQDEWRVLLSLSMKLPKADRTSFLWQANTLIDHQLHFTKITERDQLLMIEYVQFNYQIVPQEQMMLIYKIFRNIQNIHKHQKLFLKYLFKYILRHINVSENVFKNLKLCGSILNVNTNTFILESSNTNTSKKVFKDFQTQYICIKSIICLL